MADATKIDVNPKVIAARVEWLRNSESKDLRYDATLFEELAARLAEAERARSAAIVSMSEAHRLRGLAEGKLAASEMAGIVDGWRERAMKAERALALYQERLFPTTVQRDQLREELTAAQATITKLREEIGWRGIEGAPKDGTRIIGARGLFCSILRWSERGSVYSPHPGWRNANGDLVSPTHFRLLPTPPSEKTS